MTRPAVLVAAWGSVFLLTAAAAATATRVATEELAGNRLTLHPSAEFEWAFVEVLGTGELAIEKQFGAGEALTLTLTDADGRLLADGLYRYHLRMTLTEDGGAVGQSGVFYIEDGRLVAREEKRAELGEVRRDLDRLRAARAGAGPPVSPLADPGPAPLESGSEVMIVHDVNQDNLTTLALENITADPYLFRQWTLDHNDGALDFDYYRYSYGPYYWGADSFDVLTAEWAGGTDTPLVGIGTDYPLANLFIDSADRPEVTLVDSTLGTSAEIELQDNGDLEIDLQPGASLRVVGDLAILSSRTVKENLTAVAADDVLLALAELPLFRWNYLGDREAEHLGPVAEDFAAAFGLGRDHRQLSPSDVAGVALAAVQGLHFELTSREAEIEALRRELNELRRRLEARLDEQKELEEPPPRFERWFH